MKQTQPSHSDRPLATNAALAQLLATVPPRWAEIIRLLVVAEVDGARVVKKLVRRQDGGFDLKPVNPEYESLKGEDMRVLGQVRGKIIVEKF